MKKIIGFILLAIVYTQMVAGNGYYAEFTLTSSGSNTMLNGLMKIYSGIDGNSRSEIKMTIPNSPMANMNIVSIHRKSEPNINYIVDDAAKTYSKSEISKNRGDITDVDDARYDIKIIGSEKVNGYTSQHIKIFRDDRALEDIWLTKEIGDFSGFDMSSSKYSPDSKLLAEMKAKGIEGMMVRMLVETNGSKIQMDLTKFEKRDNASSLFTIPADYKEVNMLDNIMKQMNGPTTDEIMKMTPEERERFLKEMGSKYK